MSATAEILKVSIAAGGGQQREIALPPSASALADGEKPQPYHKRLWRIVNQKDGDKRVVWDSRVMGEIREAEETFNNLVEQGMMPHYASGNQKGQKMTQLDPAAEQVIFAPIPALAAG